VRLLANPQNREKTKACYNFSPFSLLPGAFFRLNVPIRQGLWMIATLSVSLRFSQSGVAASLCHRTPKRASVISNAPADSVHWQLLVC
jgi:hypothetical protein